MFYYCTFLSRALLSPYVGLFGYFILLVVMVNGIVCLISLSGLVVLVYRNVREEMISSVISWFFSGVLFSLHVLVTFIFFPCN